MTVRALKPGTGLAPIIALSCIGVAGLVLITRWGIGTSPDGVAYIRVARQFLGGAEGVASSQHAPLYSLLLALLGALGLDPFGGARWLNAATFGLNILLVGALTRHAARHCPWLAVAGAALMLVLTPMLATHAAALSEPVFLSLTLTGCWLLARYAEDPTPRRLLLAAAVVSLALLARYAGAAVVLTGGLVILLMGPARFRDRFGHGLLFGTVTALPLTAWMLRNLWAGGGATGRDLAFHPVGLSHAWEALYTASGWLLIPPAAPNVVRLAAWLALIVLLGGAAIRCLGRSVPAPPVVRVLALFVVTYGVFLAASISFLDANTPLDDRILLPALAAALVISLFLLDTLWPLARRRRLVAATAVVALVAFTGAHAVKAATLAATGFERGWGFSSRAWQQSPTIAQVRDLPAAMPVFSNAPEIVYLHTGRTARGLPRTRFLMNQQANPAFAAELSRLGDELGAACGALVYFRTLQQKAMPSEAEIRTRLAVAAWSEAGDGVILGAPACRP